jgi:hypothetical protein
MPLSFEQFRKNFGVYPVPHILQELLNFQNMGTEWYSDSFELASISKEGLKTYFGDDEEMVSQFIEFGHDGNGSTYALWLYKNGSLDDAPIVYFHSEGMGDTVVADNLAAFLTLLAWDEELTLGSYSGTIENIVHTKRNQEFRMWIDEHYHLQVPSDPDIIIREAQKKHPNLEEWINQKR